jgi:hypothetical protein
MASSWRRKYRAYLQILVTSSFILICGQARGDFECWNGLTDLGDIFPEMSCSDAVYQQSQCTITSYEACASRCPRRQVYLYVACEYAPLDDVYSEACYCRGNNSGLLYYGTLGAGDSLRSSNGRYRLQYQGDGNLVLVDTSTETPTWATHTDGRSTGFAGLDSSGVFMVRDGGGSIAWTSGVSPQHPDIPGNYFLLVQNDGNVVMYEWQGSSSPTPIWAIY